MQKLADETVTTSTLFDPARYNKLSWLAEKTGRSKGSVLRLLVDQARLADTPDIILVGPLDGNTGGRDQRKGVNG